MKKILLTLILFAFCIWHSPAATNTAASASLSAVQAAVDASSDGDTVTIPNGSATWSGGITTTKQIFIRAENYTTTLAGYTNGTVRTPATSRNVVITKTGNSDALNMTSGNSYHVGIAGIEFIDSAGDGACIYFQGSGSKIPILQDCVIRLPRNRNITSAGSQHQTISFHSLGGLMFNCYGVGTGTGVAGGTGISESYFLIESPRAWATASTMGALDTSGSVNVYIEDTTFYNTSQCPDADVGGRAVIRYCNLDGAWGLTHGFSSGNGGLNSGRHLEYYNNRMQTSYSGSEGRNMANRYVWLRGGTGIFTENNVTTAINTSQFSQGSVDQLDLGDNQSPPSYPSAGFPGWGHNGSSIVLDPIYLWNQTGNEAYSYHYESPYGSYVLLNRELYVNNGAKPGYSKYTYPHPVRAGSVGPDTSPPVISGTNVSNIAATNLTIAWLTDDATTNALDYGTTLSYGSTITISSYAASFSQYVGGLSASTFYYFRIRAGNSDGYAATNTFSATTGAADTTAPSFLSTNIIAITTSGATFNSTVDQTSKSGATWGYTTATSEGTATNGANFSTTPSITINGATANTIVYVRKWVSDAAGNTNSVLASFTTLSASAPPGAQVYYVDQTSGNDNNTGLTNSPWKNCPGMKGTSEHTASHTLNPGDTVYFDRGDTWYVSANGLSQSSFTLVGGVKYIGDVWGTGTRASIKLNARTESGIVRFASDDEVIQTWLQGFDVSGQGLYTGTGIDGNHGYWNAGLTGATKVITNCVVHDLYANSAAGDYCYGIIISDNSSDASGWTANWLVVDTVVYNPPRDGLCAYPGDSGMVSNVVFRGCYVYGSSTDTNYSEGHGILFKGNVKNPVAEFCTVTNVDSSAAFLNGQESLAGGVGPCGAKIRYNIFQTADNNGVIRFYDAGNTSTMTNNLIHDNICWGASSSGMFNMSSYSGPFSVQLYNNTFLGFVDIGNPTGSGTLNVSNNIFYGYTSTPLTDAGSDIDSHGNNLFYRTSGTTLASVGGVSYTSGTISGWEASAQTTDPAFSNVASIPIGFVGGIPTPTGIRINDGSPAENNGASISSDSDTDDIEGNPRPYGLVWDIGAYEYSVFTISGVVIDQILSTSARASFELSQAGSAGITWGTTSDTLDGASTNATSSTSHSLNMTGLASATGQYVKIHAVAGGVTNITSNYQFTTAASGTTNIVAVPKPAIRVTPRI